MTDLSPATQAIIDASNCAGSRIVQLHIAAALRALAVRINGADAIRQEWADKTTGDKRTKHVLSVQRFEFLPRTTPTEEPAF